jgi:hypothetical protein
MICYMDRTFCPFYEGCVKAHTICSRPLTPEVRAAAEKFGLPVSVFSQRPDCYKTLGEVLSEDFTAS